MKLTIDTHTIDVSFPDTDRLPMPLVHFLGILLLTLLTTAALH